MVSDSLAYILNYAAARGAMVVLPFTNLVKQSKVKRRQMMAPGGGAVVTEYGRVIAEVPAQVARNLQRPGDERDLLILIHIPRSVADEAIEVAQSPIIRPYNEGAANGGSQGIVIAGS